MVSKSLSLPQFGRGTHMYDCPAGMNCTLLAILFQSADSTVSKCPQQMTVMEEMLLKNLEYITVRRHVTKESEQCTYCQDKF